MYPSDFFIFIRELMKYFRTLSEAWPEEERKTLAQAHTGACQFTLLPTCRNTQQQEVEVSRVYICGIRGAVVSVVTSRAKGRGFKSEHGCSHTAQKPSISPRGGLFEYLANAR